MTHGSVTFTFDSWKIYQNSFGIIRIKLQYTFDPASQIAYFTSIVKIEHANSSKTCRDHTWSLHTTQMAVEIPLDLSKTGRTVFGGKIDHFGGKISPWLWYYYQNRVLEQSTWLSPSRNVPTADNVCVNVCACVWTCHIRLRSTCFSAHCRRHFRIQERAGKS